MGRLDCKEPSYLALAALARDADFFMTVADEDAVAAVYALARHGIDTSPSGAAGIAGLLQLQPQAREAVGIGTGSRILACVTEGPVEGRA